MLLLVCLVASAEEAPPQNCDEMPLYNLLDFWLGGWEVYSHDVKVGDNRIEKILGGYAVMERWTAEEGGQSKSLFFVDTDGNWKQVWVTEMASKPGGVKEKMHVPGMPGGAVRFRGEITHPDYGKYFDRTTLMPTKDGQVRQLIEISTDGESWKTTFDATYRRSE